MISIIIPTRNRPELLKRAAMSVLSQSHGAFELIIADNSDTPNTSIATIDQIEDNPGRVRYIPPPLNRLAMWANWRRGYLAARGDYVLFLPDKAILAPDALITLLSQRLSPEWVYTWDISYGITPRRARPIPSYSQYSTDQTFDHARKHAELSNVFPHGMNALYPRRALFDWAFQSSCPDYYSGCCALYKAKGVRHISQPLTYVPRNNPIASSTGAMVALGHPGAAEYLNDTPIPGDPLEDPTYCWGYVERVLYFPFNMPAYLRHTFNRTRAGRNTSKQLDVIKQRKSEALAALPAAALSIAQLAVRRLRE